MVIGVLYILLWEGSIATFAASADRLSVAAYGRVLAVEGVIDVNAPETAAPVAVIVLAVVIGAGRARRRPPPHPDRDALSAGGSAHASQASRPPSLAR